MIPNISVKPLNIITKNILEKQDYPNEFITSRSELQKDHYKNIKYLLNNRKRS